MFLVPSELLFKLKLTEPYPAVLLPTHTCIAFWFIIILEEQICLQHHIGYLKAMRSIKVSNLAV